MKIIDGWLEDEKHLRSPNFNCRPDGSDVSLLVIHNISLPPKSFNNDYIELFFQNRLPVEDHPYFEEICDLQVSSHFLIKRNGQVVQFVSCHDRAWHAGSSVFCGIENCNDFSIGIELQGSDDCPYEEIQYQRLSSLTKAIQIAYPGVTNERITGHEHISPGRKTDPGPAFDWQMYRNSL